MKVLKSPTQFKMLLVWFTFCWILKNYVIWQGKNDIFYICFLYRMIYERVKFNLIQKQVLFFLSRCYFSSISVSEILKHTIGSVPIFTGSKKCTSGTRNTMLFPKATQIFCQRKWKSRRGYLCLVSAFFCCSRSKASPHKNIIPESYGRWSKLHFIFTALRVVLNTTLLLLKLNFMMTVCYGSNFKSQSE